MPTTPWKHLQEQLDQPEDYHEGDDHDQGMDLEDSDLKCNEIGYMGNFYKKSNIKGYTGDLKNSPTVYFRQTMGPSTFKVGRITQSHDHLDNVGRALVLISDNYKFSNKCSQNYTGERMQEVTKKIRWHKDLPWTESENNSKKFYHTSRNKYHPAKTEDIEVLALASILFQYIKAKNIGKSDPETVVD